MKGAYLQAFEAYHADGEPFMAWTLALDWHLQHGVVVATERVFVMARAVDGDRPEEHALLVDHAVGSAAANGRVWHVWSAAGDMRELLRLGVLHGATEVTFQRRGGRLHRWGFGRVMGRALA
jgi:hypothetical protein